MYCPSHASLDKTPRLAQLQRMKTPTGEEVKIIQSLAPGWKDAGIYLDFDQIGQTVSLIAAEQRQNPVACCQEMFKQWLAGNGKPATWKVLIELLKVVGQNELAKQVKLALG